MNQEIVFITGGTGFVGQEVIKIIERDYPQYNVKAICRKELRSENPKVKYIQGDLMSDINEAWKLEALSSHYIIHCATPALNIPEERFKKERIKMDNSILEIAVESKVLKKLIYVSGAVHYGEQGYSWVNEDTIPNPTGWAKLVAESTNNFIVQSKKLPIVIAFPGAIYGNGSWFKNLMVKPLASGRAISKLAWDKYMSTIHVEDCARALIFLLEKGLSGNNYFLVDTDPVTREEFATKIAEVLNVPLKVNLHPQFFTKFMLGKVSFETFTFESKLMSLKLRNLGFDFKYPTIKQGILAVVTEFQKQNPNVETGSNIVTKTLPAFFSLIVAIVSYKYFYRRNFSFIQFQK